MHDQLGEDILDPGRPPRIPRWAYLAGGLLAALVVAGSVIAATHDGSAREGAPGPAAAGSSAPVGGGDLGGDLRVAESDDVLLAGQHLFRLTSGALQRSDVPYSPTTTRTLLINGLDALGPAASYRLVADAPHQRIWVIGVGTSPASVLAVDARRIAVLARAQWPAAVRAAAALDGELYLVTDNAVIAVTAAGAASEVRALTGQYLSVAADAGNDRLLLYDAASRRVQAFRPATGALTRGTVLPFVKGDLAVDADGQVWAGGYGEQPGAGAVLVRLDPRNLRPIATSPLAMRLGPGAQLVGSGSAVVWVRSGAGGNDLWCLDGRTGRPAQHWHVSGAVTSRTGVAFVDDAGTVRRLTLRGCPG